MAEFSSYAFSVMKAIKNCDVFKGKSRQYFVIEISPKFAPTVDPMAMEMKYVIHNKIMKRLNRKLGKKGSVYPRGSTSAQQLGISRKKIQEYYNHPSKVKVQVYVKESHPKVKRFKDQFNFSSKNDRNEIRILSENFYVNLKTINKINDLVKSLLKNDTWLELLKIREEQLTSKTVTKIREEAESTWKDADSGSSLQPSTQDVEPYVGIEVECLSKYDKSELIEHLVEKAPLLYKNIRIGYDGSIRTSESYPHAFEFRILCKQKDADKIITKFFNVLNGIIKVNASCGLHVHLDMRNREFSTSYERLFMSLPVLASMIPSTRREGNTYCKLNKSKTGWQDRNSDRYQAINPVSYRKFRTLEVRMHSATTNPVKVINWIRLLTLIIDKKFGFNKEGKSLEPQRTSTSLLGFFTKYEIPSDLRNYITQRIVKFGKYKSLSIPKELESIIPSTGTQVSVEQDEQDLAV